MKQEDLKKYQETVSKIKGILKYEADLKKVFGPRLGKVNGVFELMLRQMDDLAEDKAVEASGEEKSRVKEVVNLFLSIAVNRPIVPIFRDLSRFYLLLVFNWNKELGKRPDIELSVSAAQRIVEGQMTMIDTINLLKTVSERLQKLIGYEPPAFELSRHYLQSLEEKKLEKK
ncbi:unnamed protein product [marine sediment metagenome]|uniref:Uncharacterized protein n=1 Tax=marine sediment metagenome TaxID=412755 RepID=X1RCE7_9ZZZZ